MGRILCTPLFWRRDMTFFWKTRILKIKIKISWRRHSDRRRTVKIKKWKNKIYFDVIKTDRSTANHLRKNKNKILLITSYRLSDWRTAVKKNSTSVPTNWRLRDHFSKNQKYSYDRRTTCLHTASQTLKKKYQHLKG